MKKISLDQLIRMISALNKDYNNWGTRFLDSNVYNEYDGEPAYSLDECIEARSDIGKKLIHYNLALANANCSVMLSFNDKSISLKEAMLSLDEIKSTISLWNRQDAKDRKTIITRDPYDETLTNVIKCLITKRKKDEIIIKLKESFDSLSSAIEEANSTNFIEI